MESSVQACFARRGGGGGNRVGSAKQSRIDSIHPSSRLRETGGGRRELGGRRLPVVSLLALGSRSGAPAAGPVRGALRLSPPQVLELDEVPPLVLELHARAAPAAEEGWEKRGGKKGQWSMFGGALVRRGAIRRGSDARARVNSAGSRRDAGSVARRGVRPLRGGRAARAHARARRDPPTAILAAHYGTRPV